FACIGGAEVRDRRKNVDRGPVRPSTDLRRLRVPHFAKRRGLVFRVYRAPGYLGSIPSKGRCQAELWREIATQMIQLPFPIFLGKNPMLVGAAQDVHRQPW